MEGDQIELPLGFRFHPSNEELINHYLSKKVLNINFSARAISEVDMNKVEPWESPFLCLHSSLASIAGLRHQPPPPAFVTDVVIDEKVDVIISEWMGYMLVYEVIFKFQGVLHTEVSYMAYASGSIISLERGWGLKLCTYSS
ncbi:hypothetical protein LguiB_020649 [Lonicera macranthoides]